MTEDVSWVSVQSLVECQVKDPQCSTSGTVESDANCLTRDRARLVPSSHWGQLRDGLWQYKWIRFPAYASGVSSGEPSHPTES